jgi:hypothetical protein
MCICMYTVTIIKKNNKTNFFKDPNAENNAVSSFLLAWKAIFLIISLQEGFLSFAASEEAAVRLVRRFSDGFTSKECESNTELWMTFNASLAAALLMNSMNP